MRLLVPVAWLCCLHASFASEPSPAQRVANLRSVTYYTFGTRLQDLSTERLVRDVAHARDVGFNGMWLVVTWRSLSPVALPAPQLNEAAWQKLDKVIEALSSEGLSIIFPLGYFGRGWSPAGIPADRIAEWIVDEEMWGAFEDHVVRLTSRYAGRANILWMFYTESFQGPLKAYESLAQAKANFRRFCRETRSDIGHWNKRWGSDYGSFQEIGTADGRAKRGAMRWEDHFRWMCSVLRDRYGGLTRRMKTEIDIKGLVGFHDNAMITKNWAKGDTPVPADNPYDFLSFTAYRGKTPAKARLAEVVEIHGRFATRYPTVPLMIGETGVATLIQSETDQADYLCRIARFAATHSLGMNIWMWQDFKGSTPQQRSFGLLRHDGSDKLVVDALRQAFSSSRTR